MLEGEQQPAYLCTCVLLAGSPGRRGAGGWVAHASRGLAFVQPEPLVLPRYCGSHLAVRLATSSSLPVDALQSSAGVFLAPVSLQTACARCCLPLTFAVHPPAEAEAAGFVCPAHPHLQTTCASAGCRWVPQPALMRRRARRGRMERRAAAARRRGRRTRIRTTLRCVFVSLSALCACHAVGLRLRRGGCGFRWPGAAGVICSWLGLCWDALRIVAHTSTGEPCRWLTADVASVGADSLPCTVRSWCCLRTRTSTPAAARMKRRRKRAAREAPSSSSGRAAASARGRCQTRAQVGGPVGES